MMEVTYFDLKRAIDMVFSHHQKNKDLDGGPMISYLYRVASLSTTGVDDEQLWISLTIVSLLHKLEQNDHAFLGGLFPKEITDAIKFYQQVTENYESCQLPHAEA